jgi:hypothetical protein
VNKNLSKLSSSPSSIRSSEMSDRPAVPNAFSIIRILFLLCSGLGIWKVILSNMEYNQQTVASLWMRSAYKNVLSSKFFGKAETFVTTCKQFVTSTIRLWLFSKIFLFLKSNQQVISIQALVRSRRHWFLLLVCTQKRSTCFLSHIKAITVIHFHEALPILFNFKTLKMP